MVKKEKGTLEWTLYRSETDPDRFCVFEKYVDKKAIEYHVSADYFKEFGRKSAPLLVGPVDFSKIRYWNNVE
jgi:quinol monooxygenase YgiN